jgi:hypothetical protein
VVVLGLARVDRGAWHGMAWLAGMGHRGQAIALPTFPLLTSACLASVPPKPYLPFQPLRPYLLPACLPACLPAYLPWVVFYFLSGSPNPPSHLCHWAARRDGLSPFHCLQASSERLCMRPCMRVDSRACAAGREFSHLEILPMRARQLASRCQFFNQPPNKSPPKADGIDPEEGSPFLAYGQPAKGGSFTRTVAQWRVPVPDHT